MAEGAAVASVVAARRLPQHVPRQACLPRRGRLRVLAALLALLLLGGVCAPAAAQSGAPAQRVVSLVPSVTELVCALGECARLVGVDRFSNQPPSVNALPRLGGLDEAQVERILALRPDLVVAAPNARVVPRLRGLGLPVLTLPTDTLADLQAGIHALGRRLGLPAERGQALWQRMQAQVQQAAQQVPAPWRGASVLVEMDEGLYAAGAASYLGELISALGLRNIAGPELGAFPKLNPEFVLRRAPQLLIAGERSLTALQGRAALRTLAAMQQGRHCAMRPADMDLLARPGPRLGEAAHWLVGCLRRLPAPPQP